MARAAWVVAVSVLAGLISARAAAAQHIGDPCASAADCPALPFECGDGLCACQAPNVACGPDTCADIARDPKHCGSCTTSCAPLETCVEGVCQGFTCIGPGCPQPPPKGLYVSPVFDTAPGTCSSNEAEAHPTYSLNTGLLFETAGVNHQWVSRAPLATPNIWETAGELGPDSSQPKEAGSGPFDMGGDQWSGSSSFAQKEYVGGRLQGLADCTPSKLAPKPLPFTACTTDNQCHHDFPNEPTPPVCYTDGGGCHLSACTLDSQCPSESPLSHVPVECFTDGGGCNCKARQGTVPGVAATNTSELLNETLPLAKVVAPLWAFDDGPNFNFDPGGSSLWFAASSGEFRVDAGALAANGKIPPFDSDVILYPNCSGVVDSSTCRRASGGSWGAGGWVDFFATPNHERNANTIMGHTTVIPNPCTHHGMGALLVHLPNGNQIVLLSAVNHQGEIVAQWQIPAGPAVPDKGCTNKFSTQPFKCAGTGGNEMLCPDQSVKNTDCCFEAAHCAPGSAPNLASRYIPRVQMDIKVEPGSATAKPPAGPSCTLYLGYDVTFQGPDGVVRRQATLSSLNVTNDEPTESVHQLYQVPITHVNQSGYFESMNGVPVASRFAESYGFIYVQRDAQGETEEVDALVSTDPKLESPQVIVPLATNLSSSLWMGDNMSQMLGGLPGGRILATWPGLVTTTSGCSNGSPTIDGAIIVPGACGEVGEPCCGASCLDQSQCVSVSNDVTGVPESAGVCECGGYNQVCCAPNTCTGGDLYCNADFKCLSTCGHDHQPCCHSAGGVVPPSHDGNTFGWCFPTQASCSNDMCVCGGLGQSCCTGGGCNEGFTCNSIGNGIGAVCGKPSKRTSGCPSFNLNTCLTRCGPDELCQCRCEVTNGSCNPSSRTTTVPKCDCFSDSNCSAGQACIHGTCSQPPIDGLQEAAPEQPQIERDAKDDEAD